MNTYNFIPLHNNTAIGAESIKVDNTKNYKEVNQVIDLAFAAYKTDPNNIDLVQKYVLTALKYLEDNGAIKIGEHNTPKQVIHLQLITLIKQRIKPEQYNINSNGAQTSKYDIVTQCTNSGCDTPTIANAPDKFIQLVASLQNQAINTQYANINLGFTRDTYGNINDPSRSNNNEVQPPIHPTPVTDMSKLYDASTKSVNFNEQNINTLVGVESLPRVEILIAGSNPITDLKPIDQLSHLQRLDLHKTQVSDLTLLSKLHNLVYLDLRSTPIINIDALSELTNLSELYLGHTQIKSIEALGNCQNIKVLDLNSTPITNIDALSELTNLSELYLGHTQIKFIEALGNCQNIKVLDLNSTPINDISEITAFQSSLTDLRLRRTSNLFQSPDQIQHNFEMFKDCSNLEKLDLRDNPNITEELITDLILHHKTEYPNKKLVIQSNYGTKSTENAVVPRTDNNATPQNPATTPTVTKPDSTPTQPVTPDTSATNSQSNNENTKVSKMNLTELEEYINNPVNTNNLKTLNLKGNQNPISVEDISNILPTGKTVEVIMPSGERLSLIGKSGDNTNKSTIPKVNTVDTPQKIDKTTTNKPVIPLKETDSTPPVITPQKIQKTTPKKPVPKKTTPSNPVTTPTVTRPNNTTPQPVTPHQVNTEDKTTSKNPVAPPKETDSTPPVTTPTVTRPNNTTPQPVTPHQVNTGDKTTSKNPVTPLKETDSTPPVTTPTVTTGDKTTTQKITNTNPVTNISGKPNPISGISDAELDILRLNNVVRIDNPDPVIPVANIPQYNKEAHKELAKPNLILLIKSNDNLDQLIQIMSKLKNLDKINTAFYEFTGPMPDFSSLNNLKSISLNSYKLGETFDVRLLPQSIKEVNISNTQLTAMPDLKELQNLQRLDISNNSDITIDLSKLPKSLKSIKARSNVLLRMPDLKEFTNLKELDLSDNHRVGPSYKPDKLPPSIQKLTLKYTELQESCDFTNLPNLKELNLRGNKELQDLSKREIAKKLAKGTTVKVTLGTGYFDEYTIEIKGRGKVSP